MSRQQYIKRITLSPYFYESNAGGQHWVAPVTSGEHPEEAKDKVGDLDCNILFSLIPCLHEFQSRGRLRRPVCLIQTKAAFPIFLDQHKCLKYLVRLWKLIKLPCHYNDGHHYKESRCDEIISLFWSALCYFSFFRNTPPSTFSVMHYRCYEMEYSVHVVHIC